MAITDYGTLKSTVIEFTGRDNLSSLFDTLVQVGESAMYNNEDKPLRVSSLEVSATSQTIGGTNAVAVPSDYLNLRSLKLNSGDTSRELTYNSPSALQIQGSGQPIYFTVSGTNFTFDYIPDGAYDLDIGYYARPLALDATNDTNVILTKYPDIYLYACMFSVYDFSSEPELSELYYGKMLRAIRGAMKADSKGLRPNAAMRLRGKTP
jgi:hypothetical protein